MTREAAADTLLSPLNQVADETALWLKTHPGGAMVTAVRIDGTDITVTISPTSPDTFTVSLNTLKTGL